MSLFRHKPKKTYCSSRHITTLDTEHKKWEKYFSERERSLPARELELAKCKELLVDLEKKHPSNYTDDDIQLKAELQDKIIVSTREINNIKNNVNKINYYNKIWDVLVDYYCDDGDNKNIEPVVANSIMDFFHTTNKQTNDKQLNNRTNNKASLLHEYQLLVDDNYVAKTKNSKYIKYCEDCKVEKILNQSEGIYECTQCGLTELVIVESDKPNYEDPIPNNSAYAYQRINHWSIMFRWLTASLLVLCDIGMRTKGVMSLQHTFIKV